MGRYKWDYKSASMAHDDIVTLLIIPLITGH